MSRSLLPALAGLALGACAEGLPAPGRGPHADTGPAADTGRADGPDGGARGPDDTGAAPIPGPDDALAHAAWWNRLSTSPPLRWAGAPGAVSVALGVGSDPGRADVGHWRALDDLGGGTLQHPALFGAADGDALFPTLRVAWPDGTVELWTSPGWTVDITPPPAPGLPDDRRAPVTGVVSWSGEATDAGSGFSHYELQVGTSPGGGDLQGWTAVGAATEAALGVALRAERWHWVSVRAVDAAGNASLPATGPGFLSCPTHYAFMPADETDGVPAFCVSRFEMRAAGRADGDGPYRSSDVAEARPDGTPWARLSTTEARAECDALGAGHQLLSNRQWQAIAHGITATADNWSGGAVGVGAVPRGHTDGLPARALAADPDDPCFGTGNDRCADPTHADFSQRRTHVLPSGDVLWDFAGNLWEQVDGSAGGPDTLWVSYDDAVFTTGAEAEDLRAAFAPRNGWTEEQGLGRMYGGDRNLVRGGSFQPSSVGSGGATGPTDAGIHAAHHKAWNPGSTHGFRCAFSPN